jgi:uncharacterized protein YndB with AHSA1/START domain
VERVFDAPRELVFKAMTDAELIPRWWGRESSTTVVEKLDATPGGEWRFVEKSDDGDFGFYGVFRELDPPERLVWTFAWDEMEGAEIVETMTLSEQGDKTLMKAVSVFEKKEDRDGMIDAGMEKGMNESYAALDALLDELKAES